MVDTPLCRLVIDFKGLEQSDVASRAKVFLSRNDEAEEGERGCVVLQMSRFLRSSVQDEFGPANMLSVMRFIEALDKEITSGVAKRVICSVGNGRRVFTNAVFLIGAYKTLKLMQDPLTVWNTFSDLESNMFEPYADAQQSPPGFELRLIDCWQGLQHAHELGWFAIPTNQCRGWDRWGKIYKDEYAHFDNPMHGDLCEVVPGNIVAFRGPKDLDGGAKFAVDKASGVRDFSPAFYADALRVLGVTTVVSLSEATYDPTPFSAHGLRHMSLPVASRAPLPAATIAAFLREVDAAAAGGGLVAVHGGAGRARAGALAALHMMRSHGFRARAAVGWLRIMRPGAAAGPYPELLCSVESAIRARPAAASSASTPTATSPPPRSPSANAAAAAAAASRIGRTPSDMSEVSQASTVPAGVGAAARASIAAKAGPKGRAQSPPAGRGGAAPALQSAMRRRSSVGPDGWRNAAAAGASARRGSAADCGRAAPAVGFVEAAGAAASPPQRRRRPTAGGGSMFVRSVPRAGAFV